MTKLYLECHITIEPVYDERLELFKSLCKGFKFSAADLLMKKRVEDTPERSKNDSFCTGRGKEYDDLRDRMTGLISVLKQHGFQVWRYKIEDTLIDSRVNDELHLLGFTLGD